MAGKNSPRPDRRPTHSRFPELIPDRIDRCIQRLSAQIWIPEPEQTSFSLEQTAPSTGRRHPGRIPDQDFRPVPAFPYHWGRMFEFSCFKLKLHAASEPGLYLHWKDQAEATLYHQGVPYWGLDALHIYCPLPQGSQEFLIESVCCRTGMWAGATGIDAQGSRHEGLQLVRRNEDVWALWNDLTVIRDVIDHEAAKWNAKHNKPARGARFHEPFHEMPPVIRRWLRETNEALDCADRFDYAEAHTRMTALFREFPQGMAGIRAVLTGHAHIDPVWMWTERVGEFKTTHTFSTMNRMMELYPEFRFNASQPSGYEAVEAFSPELAGQIKERIAEGCWEATGATYVECDTQLACGEALARGFVIGQEGFKKLTGRPSEILWLPDVFGYSACLPQIMQQCGVRYFFTTKLTWSLLSRIPHSSFRWQGMDGTEVLVHLSTGGNGYNCTAAPFELSNGALQYRQADVHDAFLLPVGYGDGGGGVTPEIMERARRLQKVPVLPECEWGTVADFFNSIEAVAEKLPSWRGELYLEYHRGVHTTHANLKAAFRGLERALQTWEAAHSLAGRGPVDEYFWKRLIFAQFHDCIPGSSIPEVYKEHVPEMERLAARAGEQSSLTFTEPNGEPALFNPLPFPIRHFDGKSVYVLSPLSLTKTSELVPMNGSAKVQVNGTELSNERVCARISPDGCIEYLELDGQPIHANLPLGRLALYEDKPAHFDAWDIDYHALASEQIQNSPVEIRTEQTGTEAAILCSRRIGQNSSVTIRYSLRPGDSVLRIHYDMDWQEPEHLLKVHFPTDYRGRNSRYGCPYGSILRSQVPGKTDDEAQWEVPASRWAAVSDDTESEGLFVVTEAKYGFACFDGNLQVSLVRSPEYPEKDNHRHLRDIGDEIYTDLGRHKIELAIGRYSAGAPLEQQPFVLADTLFTKPLLVKTAGITRSLPCAFESGNSLHACWVKPLPDGSFVIRFSEMLGKAGILRFAADPRIRHLAKVDLLDQHEELLAPADGIPYHGYALFGVRLFI